MRMYAGILVSPAISEALNLLSPEISWYLSKLNLRTVIGCIMPSSFMETANS